jgi:spore coat polysaccharide biosynthesis predicted glycosyltransferase SpsG
MTNSPGTDGWLNKYLAKRAVHKEDIIIATGGSHPKLFSFPPKNLTLIKLSIIISQNQTTFSSNLM